ncbi:Vegetative incompatibility protein HET-E-1 [Hondaea fermentalgiana]|uniref:Vegetative incompatibility protein HET-E-1 n=1 Tax=Hondaea fermentalgiana TaxID=2315210 RepID=A0A2R5GK66_9STRA|nr:Vegetative incompatibility protein HET-E-1 [Hondaea fermentalgiana]|eukprot:GBG31267.1 Vegetative incompatibility protein HET-E-1 [Hondaea fermentalgiana]
MADVAAILVSAALQQNEALVEAVARKLPNALIPVIVDETMILQKAWHGAISYYMANELHFDYCDPVSAIVSYLLDQILAKASGAPPIKVFDAFISHEWGVHDTAKELARRLEEKHGLKMWLDAKEVIGAVDESMTHGIEGSKVFLILATKRYMKKVNNGDRRDNCLKEFLHASNQRADRIVVAALEADMTKPATQWTGQFQLALTRQVPVDFLTVSDETVAHLANAIRMRIEAPEASSDLTPLMRDIHPRLNPCSSEVWAKGKAANFTLGTRTWIIDELCEWYRRGESAVFILVGDGGVGKSVIMAELCHRGGALKLADEIKEDLDTREGGKLRRTSSRVRSLWRRSQKERPPIFVAAYHFFRHDQVTTAAPEEALVSIAWQLCLRVSGFASALDRVNLENLRNKSLADIFQAILVDPTDTLGPGQARQVVVFDALDECSKSDELLRKVIRMWKNAMPAWLSLVVSTRPEGEIERGFANNNLDCRVLKLQDEENVRDIRLHIEHLLRDMRDVVEPKDVEECAEILTERSEGLFLWASFLPDTLKRVLREKKKGITLTMTRQTPTEATRKNHRNNKKSNKKKEDELRKNSSKGAGLSVLLTKDDISNKDVFPDGLGGMFQDYFERLRDKMGNEESYQTLLAPIVVAREPLSIEHLSKILDKSEKTTRQIVGDARNLLYQGGDGRVALIHKRMADWLVDDTLSGQLGVDVGQGHHFLAEYCSNAEDAFALRHAIFHCVKYGETQMAFALLNSFAWVQKAISVGDDEAQRRSVIGNLVRDCVELGINFAPESDTPRFLSKAVHALSYDPDELTSQILARFGHESTNPLALSVEPPGSPWLEPLRTTLPHPRDPLQHVLKGHTYHVTSVAIEGEIIASGSRDNTIRIWNATSGEEQHLLKGHTGTINGIAIQGEVIVTGSNDKTVRLWSATSGKNQQILRGHSDTITSVAIDGEVIASGSKDRTIRVWNASSGELQHVLEGHSGEIWSVALENNIIVSGSSDKTVRTWDATSGKNWHSLEGHSAPIYGVAIRGETIVSGSRDNTVRVWNVVSGEEQHVLTGHTNMVSSVAIEENTIVSASQDKTIRIWSAVSGEEQHFLMGHAGTITSVAIQGDTIVSGSDDKTVRVWSTASAGELFEEQHIIERHFSPVTSVAVDGNTIVSGSNDKTVRIWDAQSAKEQHVFSGHTGGVRSVAIEGNTAVSGSSDKTVRIWDVASGDEQHVLRGHADWVHGVAIRGDIVVSGSKDKTVRIWNVTSGKKEHVLEGHFDWVTSVAVERDTVVSGSRDKTVRTWNAISGEGQRVFEGHSSPIRRVSIVGDIIESRSSDSIRFWSVSSGEELDASEARATYGEGYHHVVVERETHVSLSGVVGFTTDHNFVVTARSGSIFVIGDASGMVHILRIDESKP